jgi:hypothetical protein
VVAQRAGLPHQVSERAPADGVFEPFGFIGQAMQL